MSWVFLPELRKEGCGERGWEQWPFTGTIVFSCLSWREHRGTQSWCHGVECQSALALFHSAIIRVTNTSIILISYRRSQGRWHPQKCRRAGKASSQRRSLHFPVDLGWGLAGCSSPALQESGWSICLHPCYCLDLMTGVGRYSEGQKHIKKLDWAHTCNPSGSI